MGNDLVAQDAPSGLGHALTLQAAYQNAGDWLQSHEPEACYVDLYRTFQSAVGHFERAMDLAVPFLQQYPLGVTADMDTATAEMSTAGSLVTTATAMFQSVSCP